MPRKHSTIRKLGGVALMTVSACSLLAPDDEDFLGHVPSTPELPAPEGGNSNAAGGGPGGRARGGDAGSSEGAATSSGGSANGESGAPGETHGGQAGRDDGGGAGGSPDGGTTGGANVGGLGTGGSSSGGTGVGGALGGSSNGGAGGAGTGGLVRGGSGGGNSAGGSGVGGSPNPCGPVTPVCMPRQQETERRACTDCTTVVQTRMRTCSASCTWGAWGSWSACGVCSRGEFQCCGNRGWQFCNPATCQWHPCRDNCAADSTCDC